MTMLTKHQCDLKVPGFRERSASAWSAWKSRFSRQFSEVERDANFQAALRDATAKSLSAGSKSELEQTCTDELIEGLERAARPPTAANPQMTSSKATWQRFVNALRGGDRQAAISCLTGTARAIFKPLIEQATISDLASMATVATTGVAHSKYGDFEELLIARKSGALSTVTFIRINGEWLIASM